MRRPSGFISPLVRLWFVYWAPRICGVGLMVGLCVAGTGPVAGMGSARAATLEPWSHWTAHDETSTTVVNHDAWKRLLALYVRPGADGINRFAYGDVSEDDRQCLSDYVARLAATPVRRLRRDEQRAFWINLYNALTVQVVLDHYPVASIREIDISPSVFDDGPWEKPLILIEGEPVSLDDIEHRILRPIWRDPRLHYAVNCASLGCPNLQIEPFTAANTEELLNTAAVEYVNAPRGAFVRNGELTVSSLYVWFIADFGGDDRGVIAHLRRYARPPLRAQLKPIVRIADHHYDWTLNDTAIPFP